MTTIVDALVASIDAHYTDGGGGGAKPSNIINLIDYRTTPPFSSESESIAVYQMRPGVRAPINEKYANVSYQLFVICSTPTSDDRLKEITDEVIYDINNYPVTGINVQYVSKEEDISDRRDPVFVMRLNVTMIENMATSGAGYGSTGSNPHTHDDRYYTETEIDALLAATFGFKTITGITNDVVADATDDTLTLASTDDKLTIVGTTATDTITFTVDETKVDHDALTNFAAGEHFTMLDEDNMVSNDATKAATQQSVKAYVDAAGGGINNVVEDVTPQLGGDLDLNAHNIDFPTTANISDCLDEDNMVSNSATKLATQQSIKAYVDAGGADNVARALGMYGAANKAWVSFTWADRGHSNQLFCNPGNVYMTNEGTSPQTLYLELVLPMSKTGLELYVDDYRICLVDADATNYIDRTWLHGVLSNGTGTVIDDNTTNRTTTGVHTYATAATALGGYVALTLLVSTKNATVGALDIAYVQAQVYYDDV